MKRLLVLHAFALVICLGLLGLHFGLQGIARPVSHVVVLEDPAPARAEFEELNWPDGAPLTALQESPDLGPEHEGSLAEIIDLGKAGKLSETEASRYTAELALLVPDN